MTVGRPKEGEMSATTEQQASGAGVSAATGGRELQYWITRRRGPVEIAALGADANLKAAFEIENMAWSEVMQSDDARIALKSINAVDPDSRRDWFESENSKNYPAYVGH